jgi:hypothetical protein
MSKKHQGQCACGKIAFEFDTDPDFIANCNCNDCKRATGGAMATFFGVPTSDFTLLRGTPRSFPYVSESGKKLDRNFCPDCGARLFTSNLESFPGMVFVTIGSLVDPSGIRPGLEMFTKRRLEWVRPMDVPQFSAMPS